ncbi:MAG: NUDIX domain-containing protein [Candidatus Pacebacteria bacterium]|nr:NUDIX domain-containing protein [Candidatus Paceibacterota bacterium]
MNQEKQVIIVDQQDNEIGVVPRSEHDKHIYRVSALWVTNSQGQFLIAQRAFTKKHHPGKWGPAVAGTVDEGETYLSNIIKEAQEEIGIEIVERDLILGPKTDTLDKKYRHFVQWYFYRTDMPLHEFKISQDEVADIRWFTKEEVEKEPEIFLDSLIDKIALLENYKIQD